MLRDLLFSALIGVAALAILFQSVWAGMIIPEGEDHHDTWVKVHDWGSRTAFVLALVATIVAIVRLRPRRDLIIGSAVLTEPIFVESYIGGVIGDHAGSVAVHIPLGVALFGLALWLPMRTLRQV